MSENQAPQQVGLTIDNLFDLMFVYTEKALKAECFDKTLTESVVLSIKFLRGEPVENMKLEDALNTVIKCYNVAQESGKYSLLDAFNIVQIVMFIQNNLTKVAEKMFANGKKKEEEPPKALEPEKKSASSASDLSDLMEPVPLRGKIVNI